MSGNEPTPDFFSCRFPTLRRAIGRWQAVPEWRLDWTIRLLRRVDEDRRQARAGNRAWLLKYRQSFRRVIDRGRVTFIREYLLECPPEMIPICAWLISETTDRFRLYDLKSLAYHRSPQVRKHVAKGLWRLEAWAALREMMANFPADEKIQWYASAPTVHRTFRERLKNYQRNVDDSHAGEVKTPSQMQFWAVDQPWERTPPKSVLLIRRILRRIQHWVHWGVSQ